MKVFAIVLIDYSKAFDTIVHTTILKILLFIDFSPEAIRFIENDLYYTISTL